MPVMNLRDCTLSVLALASLAIGAGAGAQEGTAPVDMAMETRPGLNGTVAIPSEAKDAPEKLRAGIAITDAVFAAGFSGEIVVDMGGLLSVRAVSPDLASEGHGGLDAAPLFWPYASVTKQILAATLVSELDAGGFSLDTPVSEFVDGFDAGFDSGQAPVPTMRQLLTHRSGLRNPDQTPEGADGWPEFYTRPDDYGLEWCLEGRAAPPASSTKGFAYNNCDYITLGAAFDELSFEDWRYMLGSTSESNTAPFVITPENAGRFHQLTGPEAAAIAGYGASAALGGTLEALSFLNWSRMNNYADDLAAGGARAAFWQGDPALGYMALGHWVFEVDYPACPAPILVSQRKGAIGRYIVPEKREERTTEGGLDAAGLDNTLAPIIEQLRDAGIRVSLFIEANERQLDAALRLGAPVVEFHTGEYAHAFLDGDSEKLASEVKRISDMAALAAKNGIEPHAGHGLTFENVQPIAAIPQIAELNIGHYLIGEAVFIGLEGAIRRMRELMDDAR